MRSCPCPCARRRLTQPRLVRRYRRNSQRVSAYTCAYVFMCVCVCVYVGRAHISSFPGQSQAGSCPAKLLARKADTQTPYDVRYCMTRARARGSCLHQRCRWFSANLGRTLLAKSAFILCSSSVPVSSREVRVTCPRTVTARRYSLIVPRIRFGISILRYDNLYSRIRYCGIIYYIWV